MKFQSKTYEKPAKTMQPPWPPKSPGLAQRTSAAGRLEDLGSHRLGPLALRDLWKNHGSCVAFLTFFNGIWWFWWNLVGIFDGFFGIFDGFCKDLLFFTCFGFLFGVFNGIWLRCYPITMESNGVLIGFDRILRRLFAGLSIVCWEWIWDAFRFSHWIINHLGNLLRINRDLHSKRSNKNYGRERIASWNMDLVFER